MPAPFRIDRTMLSAAGAVGKTGAGSPTVLVAVAKFEKSVSAPKAIWCTERYMFVADVEADVTAVDATVAGTKAHQAVCRIDGLVPPKETSAI